MDRKRPGKCRTTSPSHGPESAYQVTGKTPGRQKTAAAHAQGAGAGLCLRHQGPGAQHEASPRHAAASSARRPSESAHDAAQQLARAGLAVLTRQPPSPAADSARCRCRRSSDSISEPLRRLGDRPGCVAGAAAAHRAELEAGDSELRRRRGGLGSKIRPARCVPAHDTGTERQADTPAAGITPLCIADGRDRPRRRVAGAGPSAASGERSGWRDVVPSTTICVADFC